MNRLLATYIKENELPENLIPIDLYFIQYRAESKNNISGQNSDLNFENEVKIKPNFINKIGYSGHEHFLPITPISLILDKEKFI
jgi:hypothetical protein